MWLPNGPRHNHVNVSTYEIFLFVSDDLLNFFIDMYHCSHSCRSCRNNYDPWSRVFPKYGLLVDRHWISFLVHSTLECGLRLSIIFHCIVFVMNYMQEKVPIAKVKFNLIRINCLKLVDNHLYNFVVLRYLGTFVLKDWCINLFWQEFSPKTESSIGRQILIQLILLKQSIKIIKSSLTYFS